MLSFLPLIVPATNSGNGSRLCASRITRQTIGKQGTPVETPMFDEVGPEFPEPVDWMRLR